MDIPEIDINGINLHYEVKGEGTPLYVLHGGPGLDHRYFGHSLAGLENIRSLHFIDFRGHGKSSKADRKTYTLDTFTRDIEAFRQAMGHETIEIMGHSMGGLVGLLYALGYPANLRSLILVNTTPKHAQIPGHYSLKARLLQLELRSRIQKSTDRATYARDVLLACWPIYLPEKMLPEYRDYIRSLKGLEIYLDMQEELKGFDVTDELENIVQPTLVIFGENDVFLDAGRPLKRINKVRFSVIPSTMHFPFLEDEKYFNIVVREFLTGKIL